MKEFNYAPLDYILSDPKHRNIPVPISMQGQVKNLCSSITEGLKNPIAVEFLMLDKDTIERAYGLLAKYSNPSTLDVEEMADIIHIIKQELGMDLQLKYINVMGDYTLLNNEIGSSLYQSSDLTRREAVDSLLGMIKTYLDIASTRAIQMKEELNRVLEEI